MPATIELIEDNRVVYMVYTAPLTLQEIRDLYPLDQEYRDNAQHKVHTLIDIRNMGDIPPGILSTRYAPSHVHPNSGFVVVLGADARARILGDMMAIMQGENHFRFFDTEDEAWGFLRKAIAEDKATEV
jgi:hypothetical protein